jgi:hypothetical protein
VARQRFPGQSSPNRVAVPHSISLDTLDFVSFKLSPFMGFETSLF